MVTHARQAARTGLALKRPSFPEARLGKAFSPEGSFLAREVALPRLLQRAIIALGLAVLLPFASALAQQGESITVSSTTSTEQSGLFKHLLPTFEKKTGISVKVVAVGTGQALDIGRRGDADVVFVHDRAAEEKFVAEGHGVKRYPVMYNDFVLIGPGADPAGVAGDKKIVSALASIAKAKAPFVSRGDRSGTHAAELRFWTMAEVDPKSGSGEWYRETGSGMGPSLNSAAAMNAYILADRGTWLSFKNRGQLRVAVEGDKRLFNQYGVMLVNPEKHRHVKREAGQAFIDWLVSPEGQAAIDSYKIEGRQLFFANAGTDT
jgi:tungstate transport system substrate-binding protein